MLVVPAAALTSRVDGTWSVQVVDGDGTREQPVRVGVAVNGTVQITDGLADGAKVVIPRAA